MNLHPRIYPVNKYLLRELPPDHPAIRALQIHAEACDECVGKEIEWPHTGKQAIEQVWFSDTDFREWRWSAFAYEFISYDLIMDGWLEEAPEATENELATLDELARARKFLGECEEAAKADNNDPLMPLIAKAKDFFDALEFAIRYRFEQYGINQPDGQSN